MTPSFFPIGLKLYLNELLDEMTKAAPRDRVDSDETLFKLKNIQFVAQNAEQKPCEIPLSFLIDKGGRAFKYIQDIKNAAASPSKQNEIIGFLLTDNDEMIAEKILIMLSDNVESFIALWVNDDLKKRAMEFLFKCKLHLFNQFVVSTPVAIDQHFYCEQSFNRLRCEPKDDSIQLAIGAYKTLQGSFQLGLGATSYLTETVREPRRFAECLEQLPENMQMHLFAHSNPDTLHSFVNKENWPSLLTAIKGLCALQVFFESLGCEFVKRIVIEFPFNDPHETIHFFKKLYIGFKPEEMNTLKEAMTNRADFLAAFLGRFLIDFGRFSRNALRDEKRLKAVYWVNILNDLIDLIPEKRNDILCHIAKDCLLACKTFKKAIELFDEWDFDSGLYKGILLAFNTVYRQKRSEEPEISRAKRIFGLYAYSKDTKLLASDALNGEMTEEIWKEHSGPYGHGNLEEIAKRLKPFLIRAISHKKRAGSRA